MKLHWKIARELERLRQQLLSFPAFFTEFIKQRRYDGNFAQYVQSLEGLAAKGSRYAIYLCFQPGGLAGSSLFTCQYLQAQGYNVMVVSNTPLPEPQLQDLRSLVWRVVLRPNFGYDFGGYRDGLRLLREYSRDAPVERVLILNDSTWYPLHADDRLPQAFERVKHDFSAVMQLHKVGKPNKYFFESYFYWISGKLFASSLFQQYWDNYRLSDIKYRAVQAGERGFSKFIRRHQISHSAIFSGERLEQALLSQDAVFLQRTLKYAAYIDPHLRRQGQAVLDTFQENPVWRQRALAHTQQVIRRRHFHASLCYASILLLGVPLLKKSSTPLHLEMRTQYLKAVQAGDLPLPSYPDLLEEIRALTPVTTSRKSSD
jgi:hypothetical protein